ncbi:PLP-dependent aminotransferase family protein [Pseudomonas sp. B21-040]|jgi:DNA-binding transcriptional MocR family regulator|uniref:aminotransferase-like domain-containing protein n=1 Tax=unclassified Pseudomonas TaxID=196821 RepID=UPI001CBB56E5|nr:MULTISPECIES: PLP-dependent aminotransferase family protein [unclassified Pseudomonas]UVL42237.1 PLP-dependent aminotransferase family protein [Pseudomonas sp. B21-040]
MTVKTSIAMVSILRDGLANGVGVKYKRLADAVHKSIVDGLIEPGCKLPPHRLLADSVGVTIGTVSRAYGELERIGVVVARVGDGTYVRQQGMERVRDAGFRNVSDEPQPFFDMSRNQPIPGQEALFLSQSLHAVSLDSAAMQRVSGYTADVGLQHYREAGARWLQHGAFAPHADQIVCVNGGQHGLLCALMALLKSGDTLVTEHLTYPGLISVARMLGIKLIGIAMDDEGLMPQALEDICRQHRVSALYCTPTIQNPTAAVMSVARREAIAQVCRQHNLLIFEDEAHAVLAQQRPLPLSYFAPERSVLIGSLSKAVSAGLRVGYLHAPQPLIGRLSAAVRGTCWMASPLTLEVASLWIENGMAEQLLAQQIAEISRRKSLVAGLLEGAVYKTHSHSPHFWIEVPEPWRASQIAAELKEKNYRVATAEAFAVGHAAVAQCVRASVCNSAGDDRLLLRGFEALVGALVETE